MKKVLASIGIGNANVDTVLPSTTVTPGETVDAEVHISGGSTEQEVDAIRFELETQYATDDGYREVDVGRFTLAEGLTIEPGQDETRQVSIDVPYGTPVTVGRTKVWIETELDIAMAVDPEDKDYLDVRPSPRLQAVFDAMDDLGFSLRTAECQADPHGLFASSRRFAQEFEFRPESGPFGGALDEVELVPRESEDALTLFVEVDRRGGLFGELTDTDERRDSLTVQSADPDAVRDDLRALIERHA